MHINHSVIAGNLTRDPEVRAVGSERSVTAFTIAHNTRYRTSSGEDRDEVTFLDCNAWGKTGEIVARFLTKGSPVLVEGRLKQERWTDKEGQARSRISLVVERVHLVGRGSGGHAPDGTGGADESGEEMRDGAYDAPLRSPASAATAPNPRAQRGAPQRNTTNVPPPF